MKKFVSRECVTFSKKRQEKDGEKGKKERKKNVSWFICTIEILVLNYSAVQLLNVSMIPPASIYYFILHGE